MIRIKKKALIILFYSTPGRTLLQTEAKLRLAALSRCRRRSLAECGDRLRNKAQKAQSLA